MIKDFTSLFYPDLCVSCENDLNKGEKYICIDCLFTLPETNYHKIQNNSIYKKFYGKVNIDKAMAYYKFIKGGKLQKILHKLKYDEGQNLGSFLGKKYGLKLKKEGLSDLFDIIIPVPLHKNKLKKRGFNQATVLAEAMAEPLQIPCSENVLERKIYTQSQTKKDRKERWKNVENAFGICDKIEIQNKRVLIIDDVITTGATIAACASILMNNGAKTVSIASLAVAE